MNTITLTNSTLACLNQNARNLLILAAANWILAFLGELGLQLRLHASGGACDCF